MTVEHEMAVAYAYAKALEEHWDAEEFNDRLLGVKTPFNADKFAATMVSYLSSPYLHDDGFSALNVLRVREAVDKLRAIYPDVYESAALEAVA